MQNENEEKNDKKIFGLVKTVHRGNRMQVVCTDGVDRLARLPGRLKRWRRISRIRNGDVVEVMPWSVENKKCDIVAKVYNRSKAQKLNDKILDMYVEKHN